jgi:steroid 5-alpha reductase family enzyme
MALSDDEQDRLDQLEMFTQAADPSFAANIGTAAVARWEQRQAVFALSASLLGILAMLAGVSAARGLISIGTVVALYGFLLTGWGARMAVHVVRRKMAQAGATREHT